MNLQQRLEAIKIRKNLEGKKQNRIKQKIKNIEREKLNMDGTHFKSGKIQKTKIIQKKKFKTQVEKGRKIAVQIQQNANPGTFTSEPSEYLTILKRTQKYIEFNQQMLENGCTALTAYCQQSKQKSITIILTLQNPIQCSQCPVLIKQNYQTKSKSEIIILLQTKKNSKQEDLTQLLPKQQNLSILVFKQFIEKYKNDKMFKRGVTKQLKMLLCQFSLFKKSKAIKKFLDQNHPVFPIDIKKVPYCLQQTCQNYEQYIEHLQNACYAVVKSGNQHNIKMRLSLNQQQMMSNIQSAVHQMVSRLIYKNKNKVEGGNRLILAQIKTTTSIPIDIYQWKQN